MSKVFKAASSIGSVALILSGTAMAGAPFSFDQWTVNNGTIATSTTECGSGFTCGSAITGLGFYQRQVTRDSDSASFFQTIVTDETATANSSAELDLLSFADENFVRTGNVEGLADKQRIFDSAGGTDFAISSILDSGWAGYGIALTQNLATSAGDFRTDFFYEQVGPSTALTSKKMKISSNLIISGPDYQDFVLIDLQGDAVGSSGNVNLTGATGGTVEWTAGDNIKAIWVGQDMTSTISQKFGFTSYDNMTSVQTTAKFSLTSVDAVNWDTAVWGTNSLETDGTGF